MFLHKKSIYAIVSEMARHSVQGNSPVDCFIAQAEPRAKLFIYARIISFKSHRINLVLGVGDGRINLRALRLTIFEELGSDLREERI